MKHTKRLLAAVMALAMVSAIAPMSAFADTQVKQDSTKQSGDMTATYDVTAKYTVTIPAGVTLDAEAEVTSNITAENVLIEKGDQVVVKLTGGTNTTEGSTFHAKKGESTAEYTISAGTPAAPVSVGDTVATFSNGTAKQTSTLTFSKPTGWTAAGEHTETLTFGIAVEDATPATVLSGALVNGATFKLNGWGYQGMGGQSCTLTYNGTGFTLAVSGSAASFIRTKSVTLNENKIKVQLGDGANTWTYVFDTATDHYTTTFTGPFQSEFAVASSFLLNDTDITSQLTKD